MFKHVRIMNGKLCVGSLDYQLSRADGSQFAGSFSGTAWVDAEKVIIGDVACQVHLDELFIAGSPTVESVEWTAGYEHGQQQKRQAWPNGKPECFVDGWRAAWKDRGRAPKDFVEHNGRVVKWSTLRRSERHA